MANMAHTRDNGPGGVDPCQCIRATHHRRTRRVHCFRSHRSQAATEGLQPLPLWVLPLAGLGFVVANPTVEEILFRGALQTMITERSGRPAVGIALQGVAFGAIHLNGVPGGEEVADATHREMRPYIEHAQEGNWNVDFGGAKTLRAGSVAARSRFSWDMLARPLVLDVAEAVLGHQLLGPNPQSPAAEPNPAARFAPGYKEHTWQLNGPR